jgi:hypothetical protein
MSILGFNAAFEKQPSEQLTIRANFTDLAASLAVTGYSLNAVELKIFDESGADQSNNMVQGSPTVDGNNYAILATVKAGIDGNNYFARFMTTWIKSTQPDQTLERDLLIQIRQKGF